MTKLIVRDEPGQADDAPRGRFVRATRGRHRVLLVSILALAWLSASEAKCIAQAGQSGISAWVPAAHSEVRLIGASGDLAGVEVRLDPGYLTYWRNPGEAGVPPRFDFSGSANVASVAVDYPAPRKLDEGGVVAFGYEGSVTFPLHVARRDQGKPASLVLNFDYAVCATQCIPAQAHLGLALPEHGASEAGKLVAAALAKIPRPSAVGAGGPLEIQAVSVRNAAGRKPALEVAARADLASAALFVEAPEGWYLQAGAANAVGNGMVMFPVAVLDRPSAPQTGPVDLRLTLIDASGAINVSTKVAADRLNPVAPAP